MPLAKLTPRWSHPTGGRQLAEQAVDDGERRHWQERADAGLREAAILERQADELAAEATRRGIACSGEYECACARCEVDGQIIRVLGDFETYIVVVRPSMADAFVATTERPRRGPIELVADRDGGFAPKDRGSRREEPVRVLEPYLDAFMAEFARSIRRGAPAGTGMDRDKVGRRVDELRAAGLTIDSACKLVGAELDYKWDSVRRAYYDHS